MALPTFQKFLQPVLVVMSRKVSPIKRKDIYDDVQAEMDISDDDRNQLIKSGVETAFENRVYWALVYLRSAGLLKRTERGVYKITEEGKKVVEEKTVITFRFLTENYPSFNDFFTPGGELKEASFENIVNNKEDAEKVLTKVKDEGKDEGIKKGAQAAEDVLKVFSYKEIKWTGRIMATIMFLIGVMILFGDWGVCLYVNKITACPLPVITDVFSFTWLLWLPVSLLMWNLANIIVILKNDFLEQLFKIITNKKD